MMYLGILVCLVIYTNQFDQYSYNVLAVNSDNIREIHEFYDGVHLLFHLPSCSFSQQYLDKFVNVAKIIKNVEQQPQKVLGIVNCQKNQQICAQYSIHTFPTLVRSSNTTSFTVINQQEFIYRYDKTEDRQQQYHASLISKWFQEYPHYAVIVLQEQGIPVEAKLDQDRVMYLQPSLLHSALLNLSNQRTGCWIFRYDNVSSWMQKYVCGTGVRPENIQAAINAFLRGEIKEFTISESVSRNEHSNEISLTAEQLVKVYHSKSLQNRIIVYVADWCLFCHDVLKTVSNVVSLVKKQDYAFYSFKIDNNQIPKDKQIVSLPYLEIWYRGAMTVYKGRFTVEDLKNQILKISRKVESNNTDL